MLAGVLHFVSFGVCLVLVAGCSGGGDDDASSSAVASPTVTETRSSTSSKTNVAIVTATSAQTESRSGTTTAVVLPSEPRLRIPGVLLDAPVSVKQVGSNGHLPDANGKDDVVIYDFSSFRLAGFEGNSGDPASGNVVMAGVVDSGSDPCHNGYVPPPCYSVFGSLSELRAGDEILMEWENENLSYQVNSMCWVDRRVDFTRFVENTPHQALTLITAAGNFSRETGYSHTLVVRAVADPASPPLTCELASASPPATTVPQDSQPTHELSLESVTSPVSAGDEVTLTGMTTVSASCGVDMRYEGRRVLGFRKEADRTGAVTFQWRIPDHYPAGSYELSAGCGGADQTETLAIE